MLYAFFALAIAEPCATLNFEPPYQDNGSVSVVVDPPTPSPTGVEMLIEGVPGETSLRNAVN
jgi:hypothetical protein